LREEQVVINRMAVAAGRPPLFRRTFLGSDRPPHFHPLTVPTRAKLDSFVHELDEMLSENLDGAFFGADVERTRLVNGLGGQVVEERGPSIALLEDWLRSCFETDEPDAVERIDMPLKEVRQLRGSPAHAVIKDVYDQECLKTQDRLLERAYVSMRTLHLVLANLPGANAVAVPDWLYEGRGYFIPLAVSDCSILVEAVDAESETIHAFVRRTETGRHEVAWAFAIDDGRYRAAVGG
jgi:hypothetical protein